MRLVNKALYALVIGAKIGSNANFCLLPSVSMKRSPRLLRRHVQIILLPLLCIVASTLFADESVMVLPWSDGRVELIKGSTEAVAKLGMSNQAISEVKAIAITWKIEYLDQVNHTGRGFDSPSAGADRRKALEDTFASIGAVLGGTGSRTVQVRVNVSLDIPDNDTLASASSPFNGGTAGIELNHLQQVIQNNVDPSPGNAEVIIEFNFHSSKPWHTGVNAPLPSHYDMRSVALHELTHALGFASWADSMGNSVATGTNPGVFSVFDSFIGKKGGVRLFTAAGQFTGVAADFVGASGGLSWYGPQTVTVMGSEATLYTPPTYQRGSSVSHWGTTAREPVMYPSINPGTRRRNYTDYEITLLRDIGYANAALPKPPFRFGVPTRFPISAASANAIAVQHIDNQNGLDLLVLQQQGPDSILTVYSGLNPNHIRTLKLPSEAFLRMSSTTVGPTAIPGVVLGSFSQGTLLSLGGLTQASNDRPLTPQDFSHVHRVVAPTPSPSIVYTADSAVPGGDLNGDGKQDFVGYSKKLGLMPFVNDASGYYDGLLRGREIINLASFGSVVRDVAPYEVPTVPSSMVVGLDVPSGLREIIVSIKDPPGSGQIRGLDSGPAVMVQNLSRGSVFGFGRIQTGEKEELVAVSFAPSPPDPYKIVNRWQMESPILQVLTLVGTPTKGVVATAGHTLEQVDSVTSVITRLAGSVQGYLDGPALTARFNYPIALCEANGVLYVVDRGNSLIRTVNLTTGKVGTLAGREGISSIIDGPTGTGTLAFNSGVSGASNCAIIGDSLYIMNTASVDGPFALRKININNGYITTVRPYAAGTYSFPRHLRAFGKKLYYVEGVNSAASLRGLEHFPENQTVDPGSLVLRLADLDNDGFDEVVNLLSTAPAINISKTRQDGSFSFLKTFTVSADPILCEVRDINSDGNKDIVVLSSNSVQVFLGDGNCGFKLDSTHSLALGGYSNIWTVVQDVNNDGSVDIVAMDAGGTLRIYISDKNGKWGNGSGNAGEDFTCSLPLGGYQPQWFQLSNLDSDSYMDLLVRPLGGNSVYIFYGQAP